MSGTSSRAVCVGVIILAACILMVAGTASSEQNPPDCGLYTYRGEIVRVVDGDTVVADLDLGFNTWLRNEHLRLNRIDAPERGTADGDAATDALSQRIEGKSLYLCTVKMKRKDREARGSFGRYLVEIYMDGVNINDWLLSEGFALER